MAKFQEKDQRIYMFPETSVKCTPLNGTLVTQNPTTYPWYSRLNIIPDGVDWDMPIQIKEMIKDIGAGKHASHVVNTVQEPSEITLEMLMVDARFLALATGTTSSAGSQKVVNVITPSTWEALNVDGTYFLLYVQDASGHQICYAVYNDVDSDQGGAPSITGATNVNVDFEGDDNLSGVDVTSIATYLDELELTLEALTEITTVTTTDTVCTITTVANAGAVCSPRNGASSPAFSFTTTTNGASAHTVTESTDSELPSFGIHIEYNNGSEDIAVDLFGCTVTKYQLVATFDNKTIRESVTFKAITYAIGAMCAIEPPVRHLEPRVWQNLVESASNYIIMIGTTDKTPSILKSLTFGIENVVDFHEEIGVMYKPNVVAGERIITMNLIGFIDTNDLWATWYDTWNDDVGYYTNAGGRLNSEIKIEKTATYDTFQLSVYNWLIETYNLRLFTIDEKIMGCDLTFTGATPDSNGRLIDSLVISDYTPKIYYNEANA